MADCNTNPQDRRGARCRAPAQALHKARRAPSRRVLPQSGRSPESQSSSLPNRSRVLSIHQIDRSRSLPGTGGHESQLSFLADLSARPVSRYSRRVFFCCPSKLSNGADTVSVHCHV